MTLSTPLTLIKNDALWVLNKPSRCHSDELIGKIPPIEREDWSAIHRLDYETSGCLAHCRQGNEVKYREILKNPALSEKLYVAATRTQWNPSTHHDFPERGDGWLHAYGLIGSRYRSSKRTHFFIEDGPGDRSERSRRGWHSVQEVEHQFRPLPSDHPLQSAFEASSGQLFEVRLLSGARHQIRAFFAAMKAPLLGDPIYGEEDDKNEERLALHAWKLRIRDDENQDWVEATSLSPFNQQSS